MFVSFFTVIFYRRQCFTSIQGSFAISCRHQMNCKPRDVWEHFLGIYLFLPFSTSFYPFSLSFTPFLTLPHLFAVSISVFYFRPRNSMATISAQRYIMCALASFSVPRNGSNKNYFIVQHITHLFMLVMAISNRAEKDTYLLADKQTKIWSQQHIFFYFMAIFCVRMASIELWNENGEWREKIGKETIGSSNTQSLLMNA